MRLLYYLNDHFCVLQFPYTLFYFWFLKRKLTLTLTVFFLTPQTETPLGTFQCKCQFDCQFEESEEKQFRINAWATIMGIGINSAVSRQAYPNIKPWSPAPPSFVHVIFIHCRFEIESDRFIGIADVLKYSLCDGFVVDPFRFRFSLTGNGLRCITANKD